jgi:hypothetical protein
MPIGVSQGLQFNGLTDYVLIPRQSYYNGFTEFTLEATVTVSVPSTTNVKFISRRNGGNSFVILGLNASSFYYCGCASNTVGNYVFNTNRHPNYGNKEVITFTYKNSEKIARVYVNGVLVGSGPLDYNIPDLSAYDFYLGASQDVGSAPAAFFNGIIHSVRIYNRSLSSTEIATGYNGKIARNGLVGEWILDGRQGSIVNDTSINGNNGILNGCRWAIGSVQQGLQFNGVSDYVDMGKIVTPPIGQDFAIRSIVTFNVIKSGVDNTIWSEDDSMSTKKHRFGIDFNGKLNYQFYNSSGNGYNILTNYTPVAGTLYDIIISNSNGFLSIYVNGSYVSGGSISNAGLNGSPTMKLGRFRTNTYTSMKLYNMSIYNRALSATEIASMYNGNANRNGLIGEWLFAEGQGTTATDTSGNGNNGILNGCRWLVNKVSSVKTQKQGLIFDGVSSYVDCGNAALFNSTSGLTAEVCFKFPPGVISNGWNGIFCKSSAAGTPKGWYILTTNANRKLTVGIGDGGTKREIVTGTDYDANWHVAAITWDSIGKILSLYVDGVYVGSTGVNAMPAEAVPVRFGCRSNGTSFANVIISYGRLYNRALSGAEVQSNYNGNVAKNGLVGEWLLADGIAKDTSGNGNHGTINGALFLIKNSIR